MVLSADDQAQQAVMDVHNDLVARGLARWTSWDIPEAVSESYVVLAADMLGPLFGAQTDRADAAAAKRSLYQYIALPSSGERVPAEYF
jgi:hypothetical protein